MLYKKKDKNSSNYASHHVNQNWLKFLLVFIVLFSIVYLPSCSNEPFRGHGTDPDSLFNILSSKKIIFFSEDHIRTNPFDFLTDNLDTLYALGVRFIFVEGGRIEGRINSPDQYFRIYYPFIVAGWKYEFDDFFEKAAEINAKAAPGQQLNIIYAEDALNDYFHKGLTDDEYLDIRDDFAYRSISQAVDNSAPEEKALIIYGGAHGMRLFRQPPQKERLFYRRGTLGQQLWNRYRENFISIDFQTYIGDQMTQEELDSLGGIDHSVVVLPHEDFVRYGWGDPYYSFDYTIVQYIPEYGTCYQYHPDEDILLSLANMLLEYNRLPAKEPGTAYYEYNSDYGQMTAGIYYMKLLLGDGFDFSYRTLERDLESSIFKAMEKLQASNKSYDFPSFRKINQYHGFFASAYLDESFEDFDDPDWGLGDEWWTQNLNLKMMQAYRLNPHDIISGFWYGFSLLLTEEYEQALIVFDEISKTSLTECFDGYPILLQMAMAASQSVEADSRYHDYLQEYQEIQSSYPKSYDRSYKIIMDFLNEV